MGWKPHSAPLRPPKKIDGKSAINIHNSAPMPHPLTKEVLKMQRPTRKGQKVYKQLTIIEKHTELKDIAAIMAIIFLTVLIAYIALI